jgi:hypothetical protein
MASTTPSALPSPTISPSGPSASPKSAAHHVPRKRPEKEEAPKGD